MRVSRGGLFFPPSFIGIKDYRPHNTGESIGRAEWDEGQENNSRVVAAVQAVVPRTGCFRDNRDDSPWYPTMRLFRQPAFLNWDDAVKAVVGELSLWAERMRPTCRDQESSQHVQ